MTDSPFTLSSTLADTFGDAMPLDRDIENLEFE